MDGIWAQWQALDAATQSAVIGVLVSAGLGVAKKVWPQFRVTRRQVKFASATVAAAVAGFATGGWSGAVIAVLAALGTYDAVRNVGRLTATDERPTD